MVSRTGEVVGDPGGVGVVVGGAFVPGVDAAVVQIPAQRCRITLAQLQTGGRFGVRGEPHDVGECHGRFGCGRVHVGVRAAGFD